MGNKVFLTVITKFSLYLKSLTLAALLVILGLLMVRQIYTIGQFAVSNPADVHLILEQTVNFFLYFAFFTMIVTYFRDGEYFQLRNLIYIGITATLRFIIVNRSDVFQNVLLAIVILLLIFGYLLLTPSQERLHRYIKGIRRVKNE